MGLVAMFDPHADLELIRVHGRELSEDYRCAGHAQQRLGAHLRRLFAVAENRRHPNIRSGRSDLSNPVDSRSVVIAPSQLRPDARAADGCMNRTGGPVVIR